MKKFILALLLILVLPFTSFAFQADVKDISQDKYFQATLDSINSAKKSIFMVMYYISFNPFNKDSKPYKLTQSLISAHRRGVKVKVILDQTLEIPPKDDEAIENWQLLKAKNIYVYELLQREGIDVSFDEPSVNTHSKVLVIDNETIFLGSSNWTETALNSNVESNLLVKSKPLAESLINNFKSLETHSPHIISQDSSIPIPLSFLENKSLLPAIASRSDELAFDLYLTILRYAKDNSATLSYVTITKDLALKQKDPRALINRALNTLKDRYKLISFNKDDIFRKDTLTLHLNPLIQTHSLNLPLTYFTYNWHKTLSLRSKVLYLVSLSYYNLSDSKPWFFVSQDEIKERFHIKPWYISNGMQELRKQNVIDIRYSKLDENSQTPRLANYYKLLGLYDPDKVDQTFKNLSQRYGEASLQRARSYAKCVFKENDPQAIETLLQLMTDYTEEVVQKAVTIILKKRPDNPKRTFSYLKGIIQNSPKPK